MKKKFAVRSGSFETYYKFKLDLENMGYKYNYQFLKFTEDNMSQCNSIYVTRKWNQMNDYQFCFTNTDDNIHQYFIDNEIHYKLAIEHAYDLITNIEPTINADKEIIIKFLDWLETNSDYYVDRELVTDYISKK